MSQLASAIDIGQVHFKNKMIKGAMSEALANHAGQPNHLHLGLYEAWAKGGLGCAITGNVMVDFRAKNEPGVVAGAPAASPWSPVCSATSCGPGARP